MSRELGFEQKRARQRQHFFSETEAPPERDEELTLLNERFVRGNGFKVSSESDKADLDRAPAKPAPVGTIQDLRQALQRAYLGGLIGVTFYLDRSEDRVTSVVLDETWAIVL